MYDMIIRHKSVGLSSPELTHGDRATAGLKSARIEGSRSGRTVKQMYSCLSKTMNYRTIGILLGSILCLNTVIGYPTRSMCAARNILLSSENRLPYDAEVEYIDTVIPAYIETGVRPTLTCDVTIDGYWLSSGGSGLGTLLARYNDASGCLRYRSSSWCELLSNTAPPNSQYGNWVQINVKTTQRHTFQMGASGVYVDGVEIFDGATFVNNAQIRYTFKISGYNEGNTQRQGKCRIYRFTIVDGGETKMDLVPVRVGEEGAMYDLVSKKVFFNAKSTGSLVPGPDKE